MVVSFLFVVVVVLMVVLLMLVVVVALPGRPHQVEGQVSGK